VTVSTGLRLVWFTLRLHLTREHCTVTRTSTRSCPEQRRSQPTSCVCSWWTGSYWVVDGLALWDSSAPPRPVSSVFQSFCQVSVRCCSWCCCILDESKPLCAFSIYYLLWKPCKYAHHKPMPTNTVNKRFRSIILDQSLDRMNHLEYIRVQTEQYIVV